MSIDSKEHLFDIAKKWVLEAGKEIRKKMNHPISVELKSGIKDLVTTLDKETEKFFVDRIRGKFPNHRIISEEGYGDKVDTLHGIVWIIDPIDGTTNFVHQQRNFAISLGIYRNGIGEIGLIYDVMQDKLYSAMRNEGAYKNNKRLPKLEKKIPLEEAILALNHTWLCNNRLVDEAVMQHLAQTLRGTRTYGSAALEFAYVAEGIIDGYLAMSLQPWDVAAGIVLVNEVGGITTTIGGEEVEMLEKNSIFTSNKYVHIEVIENFLEIGRK